MAAGLIIRAARQQGQRNTGRVSKNKANWNVPETMRKYLYPHRESGSVEWRPPDHPPGLENAGAMVRHAGILATTPEGAALCFRAFCQQGASVLGPHEHPDVTLDCIALARSLPAWERGDLTAVRTTLSVSVHRLARAGAGFFACPDNTAHRALEQPGPSLALPGLHIAEVVAEQAARGGQLPDHRPARGARV